MADLPPSFEVFRQQTDTTGQEAIELHSLSLGLYRLVKAAELGLTLEELHDMPAES